MFSASDADVWRQIEREQSGVMRCGHCGRSDSEVDRDHVWGCSQFRTIEDLESLLQLPAPPFDRLLDGIAISRRENRLDLRDRCIQLAVASVTGETPGWKVKNLMREAAQRQLERADTGTLMTDVRDAASVLRGFGAENPSLRDVAEAEAEILDHIGLAFAQGSAPALLSAAARLRRMERPDLALHTAERAALIEPYSAVPRTIAAAALVDLLRPGEGLGQALAGEELGPSRYTSSTTSRAYRALDDIEQAVYWAEETIKRDPASASGYRTLFAAAMAAEDKDLITSARERLESLAAEDSGPGWSRPYAEFLAARELLRTGDQARGLKVIYRLANEDYQPARRELLRYDKDRPDGDGRPPRRSRPG